MKIIDWCNFDDYFDLFKKYVYYKYFYLINIAISINTVTL